MRGPSPATRIALFLPNLGGGGAERIVLGLAAAFAAREHAVDLVLVRAEGELLNCVPPGVRLVTLGARRLLGAIGPLTAYLRTARPAVLHASMWPLTTCAVAAHRLAGSTARLVLTEQVNMSADLRHHRATVRAVARLAIAASYRFADVLTAVSAGVAHDIADLAWLGRDRVAVVPNFAAPVRAEGPQVDWGGPGKRILTVGSFKPQKNHALFLAAAARIAAATDARFAIVGDGVLRPELEAQARRLGLADRLLMPGFAQDPSPWFRSADLFLLSSDFEGMPLVLIEALAHGLPIVSTDCPDGPREVLADGAFGRLVPPRSAEALADAALAALAEPRDPARQRTRGEMYGLERVADRYLELMLPQPVPAAIPAPALAG